MSAQAGVPDLLGELVAELRALRLEVAAFRREEDRRRLLTVSEKATELGRSEDWVRNHRNELAVVAIGEGPKPRLYFPPGPPRRPRPVAVETDHARPLPPIRASGR